MALLAPHALALMLQKLQSVQAIAALQKVKSYSEGEQAVFTDIGARVVFYTVA